MELTDESDVFGITSVINLTSHKETPCVKEFFELLDDLATEHAKELQQELKQILQPGRKLGMNFTKYNNHKL